MHLLIEQLFRNFYYEKCIARKHYLIQTLNYKFMLNTWIQRFVYRKLLILLHVAQ